MELIVEGTKWTFSGVAGEDPRRIVIMGKDLTKRAPKLVLEQDPVRIYWSDLWMPMKLFVPKSRGMYFAIERHVDASLGARSLGNIQFLPELQTVKVDGINILDFSGDLRCETIVRVTQLSEFRQLLSVVINLENYSHV